MTSRGKEGDALTEEVSLETLNKGPKEREAEEEDAEDNEIKAQQLALISEPLLAKKDPNAPFPLCKDDDAASEYWYNPEEPTGIYEKPSPKDHVFECTMVISDIVITMMEAIYFSVVVGEHPNCNASDWPFLCHFFTACFYVFPVYCIIMAARLMERMNLKHRCWYEFLRHGLLLDIDSGDWMTDPVCISFFVMCGLTIGMFPFEENPWKIFNYAPYFIALLPFMGAYIGIMELESCGLITLACFVENDKDAAAKLLLDAHKISEEEAEEVFRELESEWQRMGIERYTLSMRISAIRDRYADKKTNGQGSRRQSNPIALPLVGELPVQKPRMEWNWWYHRLLMDKNLQDPRAKRFRFAQRLIYTINFVIILCCTFFILVLMWCELDEDPREMFDNLKTVVAGTMDALNPEVGDFLQTDSEVVAQGSGVLVSSHPASIAPRA